MVDGDQALLDQHTQVRAALANVQPNRVITLGGDCAVSAVPFDYLHGRYPDDFGVIWLDAHPDISTVKDSHHFHEMVVSNLLKVSGSGFDGTDADLVGLTIAEHMPWDAIRLRKGLSKLKIFSE
jgi:arginase